MGMRISYEWDPLEGYPEGSRRVGTPHLPRVVCKYEDIFLDKLSGLPPLRDVDFTI